jgi:putative phosphoesterase
MKLAIMSDSHDNIWNMRRAVARVRSEGADMILHCGDFVAPFMLKELAAAGVPVHGVFGNNDGDQFTLSRMCLTDFKNIHLHGPLADIDVDGFRIALTHYFMAARGLARTGEYDLVCFGHSHEHHLETIGGTTLLNPGEIMGKEGPPTFCTVDTTSREVRRISFLSED